MSLDQKPLTIMGEKTPRVVIYKSESHKLHEAFCVKTGNKIIKGMPVALTDAGELVPYTAATGQVYIGIAVTDNEHPAYSEQRNFPVEVTVMVEAYATCNYVSDAALKPGYVKPTGNVVSGHFVEVTQSTTETKFIAITEATGAHEVVRVLVR